MVSTVACDQEVPGSVPATSNLFHENLLSLFTARQNTQKKDMALQQPGSITGLAKLSQGKQKVLK